MQGRRDDDMDSSIMPQKQEAKKNLSKSVSGWSVQKFTIRTVPQPCRRILSYNGVVGPSECAS